MFQSTASHLWWLKRYIGVKICLLYLHWKYLLWGFGQKENKVDETPNVFIRIIATCQTVKESWRTFMAKLHGWDILLDDGLTFLWDSKDSHVYKGINQTENTIYFQGLTCCRHFPGHHVVLPLEKKKKKSIARCFKPFILNKPGKVFCTTPLLLDLLYQISFVLNIK